VLIIGILAAIALQQYTKAVRKSQAVEAITAVKALSTAEEAYYLENSTYTADFNELNITVPPLKNYTIKLEVTADVKAYNTSAATEDAKAVFRYYFAHPAAIYQQYAGMFLCVAPQADANEMALCKMFGKDIGVYAVVGDPGTEAFQIQ